MTVSKSLIVISGPPRSGTTLVNRLLCASPKCAPFLPECSFITKGIEQYINVLLYADKERFSAYFSTHEECRACFQKCVGAHLESLYIASPHIGGHEHIVLKDPMLSYYLSQAQDLLPVGTRFVIMVRNPLAVVASMKKVVTKQKSGWNIKAVADEIFNFYFHLHRTREAEDITSACFVRYEDLVLGNWGELESFLGFPVSDEFAVTKQKNEFDQADPFYSPFYKKPISNKRIDAWRGELSDLEISYVRDVFAGVMEYWQYA